MIFNKILTFIFFMLKFRYTFVPSKSNNMKYNVLFMVNGLDDSVNTMWLKNENGGLTNDRKLSITFDEVPTKLINEVENRSKSIIVTSGVYPIHLEWVEK